MVNQTVIPGPVPTVLHQEVVLNQLPQPNRQPAPAPLRAPQLSSRANAPTSAGSPVPVRAAGSIPIAGRMPQPPAGRMPQPPAGRMPRPLFPAPPMVQMPNPFMQMMGLAMPPMAPMPPGGAVPQASGTLPQFLPPGIPAAGQSSPQLSTLDPYLACTARQWTRDFEEADEESEDEPEGSSTEQQQTRATGRTPRPPRQQQQSELPMNAITITIPNVAVNAQLGFGPNGGPAAPPSPGGFPIPGMFPPGGPVPPPGAIPNPMQMIQQMMPMLMAGMAGMAGGPRPPGAPPAGFPPGGPFMTPGLFGPAAGAGGAGGMLGAGMPTMGQMIAAMGGRMPSETGAQSMFEQLLVAITSRLNIMDNVALMSGDFRPLNNLQPVIREYLTRSLFDNDPNAGLDPERQKQAAEQIMRTFAETNMAAGLQANPNNSRGAVDLAATYRQVELSLLERLIRSTYSESDRAYGDRIHDAFGDFMFELQVVSNHCVVGGYDAFLNNLERVIVCYTLLLYSAHTV